MERTNCMESVIIHWIVDSYQWYDLLDSQFKFIFSNLCLLVLNWWRIHQDLPSNGLVLSTPTYFLGSKARDCKMNWSLYDLMKCILINNNGDKSMFLYCWTYNVGVWLQPCFHTYQDAWRVRWISLTLMVIIVILIKNVH